jgi:hypothetical protein
MRISRAVILMLADAVAVVLRDASFSARDLILAVIVPAYFGVACGLIVWLAVLYRRRRIAGNGWSRQMKIGVISVAIACAATAVVMTPLLPAGATLTALGATAASVAILVLLAAPQFGWDRHPRW